MNLRSLCRVAPCHLMRLRAANDAVATAIGDTSAACCRAGHALRVVIALVSKMHASKAASYSCWNGNAPAPGLAPLLASPIEAVT